jgi:hypothetical protein
MEYDIKFDINDLDETPEYPEFDSKDFSTIYLKFIKMVNDEPKYLSIHFEHFNIDTHIPLHIQVKQQYNDTSGGSDDLPFF